MGGRMWRTMKECEYAKPLDGPVGISRKCPDMLVRMISTLYGKVILQKRHYAISEQCNFFKCGWVNKIGSKATLNGCHLVSQSGPWIYERCLTPLIQTLEYFSILIRDSRKNFGRVIVLHHGTLLWKTTFMGCEWRVKMHLKVHLSSQECCCLL